MTVTTQAHSRRAQSNGAANIQTRNFHERVRGNHGSIGGPIHSTSPWTNGSTLWSNSGADANARSTFAQLAGSSSLLDSSDELPFSPQSNPWNIGAQGNGMTPNSIQRRSAELNGTTLTEPNDFSDYFTQTSSGMGPSPGVGQRFHVDTGPERISPNEFYSSGDRNVEVADHRPTSFQTASGYTSPRDDNRSEYRGSMKKMAMTRTMADYVPRNPRNGLTHSTHNSASHAPQRPIHSNVPSFHSESQFSGRYGDPGVELSSNLERLQMNEPSGIPSRPPFQSHVSDTSLNLSGYRRPSEEQDYQAVQDFGNEALSPNNGMVNGQSLHFGTQGFLPAADYPNGTLQGALPTGPRHPSRNGFPSLGLQKQTLNPQRRQPDIHAELYHHQQQQHQQAQQQQVLQQQVLQQQLLQQQRVAEIQAAHLSARQRQHVAPADYTYQQFSSQPAVYHQVPHTNVADLPPQPRRESRPSVESLSPRLIEFRTQYKSGKYHLQDCWDHIVEFAGDQHGSRFLQGEIESAKSDEKSRVFEEIEDECMQLAQDIFGNYVVQKMFSHGLQQHKRIMANKMKNKIFTLTMSPYGCRVVQRALEHVLSDQRDSMIRELEPRVLDCVDNQHGNHVIQKALECAPGQVTRNLALPFKGQVEKQAMHLYGCRIIQRMLEFCLPVDTEWILAELHPCTARLIENQYGNYVVQHVLSKGSPRDRSLMIDVVKRRVIWYSKHKFASNVVEKSLDHGDDAERHDLIMSLTGPTAASDKQLLELMQDQYGNYVFQKALKYLEGEERAALVERIKPLLAHLKKTNTGKQILSIEGLILNPSPPPIPAISSDHASTTPPNSHKSSPQQPLKRPVDGRFHEAPPTPPPIDNQANVNGNVSLHGPRPSAPNPTMQ